MTSSLLKAAEQRQLPLSRYATANQYLLDDLQHLTDLFCVFSILAAKESKDMVDRIMCAPN